MTYNLSLMN